VGLFRFCSRLGVNLGVNRHTVESRLGTAQQHLGRPLHTCLIELKLALRLEQCESAEDRSPAPHDQIGSTP
jgi:hypothetical protein